jgi:hypothetical protein
MTPEPCLLCEELGVFYIPGKGEILGWLCREHKHQDYTAEIDKALLRRGIVRRKPGRKGAT